MQPSTRTRHILPSYAPRARARTHASAQTRRPAAPSALQSPAPRNGTAAHLHRWLLRQSVRRWLHR